jgi:hypothetical protein
MGSRTRYGISSQFENCAFRCTECASDCTPLHGKSDFTSLAAPWQSGYEKFLAALVPRSKRCMPCAILRAIAGNTRALHAKCVSLAHGLKIQR